MEQIKKEILKILQEEQINVEYFKIGYEELLIDHPTELAIKIKSEDLDKWNYFTSKLNENQKVVFSSNHNNLYKFTFNASNNPIEKQILTDYMSQFLNAIKNKYFKVCPSVNNFSILIKPTHRCNLECKYCYDKPFREKIKDDMSMEVLEQIIYLLSNYTKKVNIIWHGGEPTMVGTRWYEKAYKVISNYPMLEISSSIMTNGVALNDKWFELFEKYNINPGMSYNSIYQTELRCSRQECASLENELVINKKLENILEKHKIGVIEVINKENYKNQIEIYEYYKKIRRELSMNHVFHTEQTYKNNLELLPEEYAEEFKKYFKHWLYDKDGISERTAETMLKFVIGNNKGTCEHSDCRRMWLGINPLGEIYPCDRYYPDKYKVGKISDYQSISDIFKSEAYLKYFDEVQTRFDNKCKKCAYWYACHGGCNASVIETRGKASEVDEFSCKLFQLQFNIVYDAIREIELIWDENINPYAKKIMIENNFYSVKEIKRYIVGFGVNLENITYDSENVVNCNEYELFRGVNYIKDDSKYSRHIDFISSDKDENKIKNEQMRRKNLYKYFEYVIKGERNKKLDNIDRI